MAATEKVFKESDERREQVLVMKGVVVAKVTVPPMKLKVRIRESRVLELSVRLGSIVTFRVCDCVLTDTRQDLGGLCVMIGPRGMTMNRQYWERWWQVA